MKDNWIPVAIKKPDVRGFYLCLSNSPYSSWAFVDDNNDRYMDCITYCLWTGTCFYASNVEYWMPVPSRPKNWEFRDV